MPRSWPLPQADTTIHALGDLHIEGMNARRQAVLRNDMLRPSVPSLGHHLQLGDLTLDGTPTEDAAGVAFMESLGGEWHAVVGNHDVLTPRTAADASAAWGMPGANFTVDLGFCVLLCLGWGGGGNLDDEWLNTAAQANSGRDCLVAAHAPLYETVGASLGTNSEQYTSVDSGFYVPNDTDVRTVLADNPHIRGWLSGHTHSLLSCPDIVKREQVLPGAHYIAHVNAGSPLYTGKGAGSVQWTDTISSAFITVLDDTIEVRYRDHGAHLWVGSGPDLVKVWSIDA